jgi:hypothetical protein
MQSDAKNGHCALARANRVFGTDEKRIRTKNTVLDKSNNSLGLVLYTIADCARTAFRPCAIGDPRGRAAVRASPIAAARAIQYGCKRNRRSVRTIFRPRNSETL